jgi:H+-transporting ATPase
MSIPDAFAALGLAMAAETLLAAVAAEVIAGTGLTLIGLSDLEPLPWWQMLAIFAYAMFFCLVVNDGLKVLMLKRRTNA